MRIITNHHVRDVIDAWQLTPAERAEFDYLDWPAIDDGRDSASFVRYRGELHDLGQFTRDYGITRGSGLPESLSQWDGYRADSYFSATVVRYARDERGEIDSEGIVVGLALSGDEPEREAG